MLSERISFKSDFCDPKFLKIIGNLSEVVLSRMVFTNGFRFCIETTSVQSLNSYPKHNS